MRFNFEIIKNNKFYLLFFENKLFGEKIRYIFIGGLCASLDILILFIFVNFFHLWYLLSSIISFSLITSFGYFAQKHFTFRDASQANRKQIITFFVITGLGLILNTFFIYLFTDIFHFFYILGAIITKFVVLIWNFSANKYITFKNDKAKNIA